MINPEVIAMFLDQDAPMRSVANMADAVKELEDYLVMAEYRSEEYPFPYVVGLDGVYLAPTLTERGDLTGKSETFLNPLYATRYNREQSEDIAAVSHSPSYIVFKSVPLHLAVEDALEYYQKALQRMQTMIN